MRFCKGLDVSAYSKKLQQASALEVAIMSCLLVPNDQRNDDRAKRSDSLSPLGGVAASDEYF